MSKKNLLNYVAILGVCFFAFAGNYMNVAIQTFQEAFPNISQSTIMLVSTLPGLVSVPVMLIIGRIVGKKIKYKTVCMAGICFVVVGGVMPYFISSSWTFILVCRAVLGIGAGLLGVRNSLVIKSLPPEKQAAFTGYATVAGALGGAVAGPVVGKLVELGWNAAFLYDFVPVFVLILIITSLKEPEIQTEEPEPEIKAEITAGKEKLSWKIYVYALLMLIAQGVIYPLCASGMSTFMDYYDLGNASVTGIVMSSFPVFGVLSSVFLGQILKTLKRFVFPVASAIVVIGQLMCLFIHSVPFLILGCGLAGLGFHVFQGGFQVYNGREAPSSKIAAGSTMIIAFNQLGVFFSSYYISGCDKLFGLKGSSIDGSFLGCILIYAAIAVFTLVVNITPGKKASKVK